MFNTNACWFKTDFNFFLLMHTYFQIVFILLRNSNGHGKYKKFGLEKWIYRNERLLRKIVPEEMTFKYLVSIFFLVP